MGIDTEVRPPEIEVETEVRRPEIAIDIEREDRGWGVSPKGDDQRSEPVTAVRRRDRAIER